MKWLVGNQPGNTLFQATDPGSGDFALVYPMVLTGAIATSGNRNPAPGDSFDVSFGDVYYYNKQWPVVGPVTGTYGYYGGFEGFEFRGNSGTIAGGEKLIVQIVPDADVRYIDPFVESEAGDPTVLSNGTTTNVIYNRQMWAVSGTSATPGYICDFDQMIYVNQLNPTFITTAFAPVWNTATLNSGWTGNVRYRKDPAGQIFIEGSATYTAGGFPGMNNPGTVFTLLSGFAPSYSGGRNFMVSMENGAYYGTSYTISYDNLVSHSGAPSTIQPFWIATQATHLGLTQGVVTQISSDDKIITVVGVTGAPFVPDPSGDSPIDIYNPAIGASDYIDVDCIGVNWNSPVVVGYVNIDSSGNVTAGSNGINSNSGTSYNGTYENDSTLLSNATIYFDGITFSTT